MEGLCLPVFKLLQKTPRGKKTTKGNSFFDRLGREGGGVADSLRPPALPPAVFWVDCTGSYRCPLLHLLFWQAGSLDQLEGLSIPSLS